MQKLLNCPVTHSQRILQKLTIMIFPGDFTQSANAAFVTSNDRWITCDWTTDFGALHLNLNGLRSFQLERLAHATSGRESHEWRNAAAWVKRVENDAAEAQSLAQRALDAFQKLDFTVAIDLAERAVQLELAWHSEPIWGLLLHAVRSQSEFERGEML
jgi:hypothetical protein